MANYTTERTAGREHIPLYPKAFVTTRILQLVVCTSCLGLSAYAVSAVPVVGAVLTLFTSLVTFISSIYLLVAHFGPPRAYNYWAILGLDIFLVIFWLISFVLLAAQSVVLLSAADDYYDGYVEDAVDTYGTVCAAAAGLGAIEWIIYLVALIIHSIALHRHRKAGLFARPGQLNGAAPAAAPEQKFEMQPQPTQTYYSPQPVQTYYTPQPVYEVHNQQHY
ncbi:hypothetical protein GGS21DRAFT_503498 [Xylaria nigripes]|nr:hypothetical protein GGS21DRAFT_503498 [Xylaria nigripes]